MAQRHLVVSSGQWIPVGLALLALAAGLVVYLADRPTGHALLIPASWSWRGTAPLYGSVGHWLPSALHPLAFILLSAAAWPRRRAIVGPCLLWWTLDIAAECAQHPSLSAPLAAAWSATPGLDLLARFAQRGTFDVTDLAAVTAGTLAAAVVLMRLVPVEVPDVP